MKKKTYRTRSKKLILNYLKDNSSRTVSASDIYDLLKSQGETTNITTVYRDLEQLEQDNVIVKYATENTKKACFYYTGETKDCNNHLHIQCTKCGKIIHLDCEAMAEFQKHIQKEHGITLDCSTSLLYGICDDCKKEL